MGINKVLNLETTDNLGIFSHANKNWAYIEDVRNNCMGHIIIRNDIHIVKCSVFAGWNLVRDLCHHLDDSGLTGGVFGHLDPKPREDHYSLSWRCLFLGRIFSQLVDQGGVQPLCCGLRWYIFDNRLSMLIVVGERLKVERLLNTFVIFVDSVSMEMSL